MTKTFCDRCKSEVERAFVANIVLKKMQGTLNDKEYEVCQNCISTIDNIIWNIVKVPIKTKKEK